METSDSHRKPPKSSKRFREKLGRRHFLQGLSGAAAFALVGCGGSDEFVITTDPVAGIGAGGGGGGGGGGGSDLGPNPPITVTAQVDTTQVGGSGLNVFSIFDDRPEVGAAGSAQVKVSSVLAQVLVLLDGEGMPRAMTVSLSDGPVTFDARSTALALVFLTPGIATTGATQARDALVRIEASAGFAALTAALVQRLPGSTIPQTLADATVQTLLAAAVQGTADPIAVQPRILARTVGEMAEIERNGGAYAIPDSSSPPSALLPAIW